MKTILFVCTANSGRSQMAEGFFNHLAKGKAKAISAGISPAEQVHPKIIEIMQEAGIDIRNPKPKQLTTDMLQQADLVITMGCEAKNACPASFTKTQDWDLEDPKGKSLEETRPIRDQIKVRVERLLSELHV